MILIARMTLDYHDYIGSKFTKILCYGNETYNLIKYVSLENKGMYKYLLLSLYIHSIALS